MVERSKGVQHTGPLDYLDRIQCAYLEIYPKGMEGEIVGVV